MTQYQRLYYASWAVLIIGALADGVNIMKPEALGLPPVVAAWIALLALIARAVQAFLPQLQRPPVEKDNPQGSTRDPSPRDE